MALTHTQKLEQINIQMAIYACTYPTPHCKCNNQGKRITLKSWSRGRLKVMLVLAQTLNHQSWASAPWSVHLSFRQLLVFLFISMSSSLPLRSTLNVNWFLVHLCVHNAYMSLNHEMEEATNLSGTLPTDYCIINNLFTVCTQLF